MSARKHHRSIASSRVEPMCSGLRYLRQQNQTEDSCPRLVHLSTRLTEKYDDPTVCQKSWEKACIWVGV